MPTPESVPPLSSIMSQPADVFGIDRSAVPVLVAAVVEGVVAGAIVLRPEVVLGCVVV